MMASASSGQPALRYSSTASSSWSSLEQQAGVGPVSLPLRVLPAP